jgi:RNA methyltransferase, TrmH family
MGHKLKLFKPLSSQIKLWEKLSRVKYRRQEGLFLAEGLKIVQALLKSDWEFAAILVKENNLERLENFLSTISDGIEVYGLKEKEWEKLTQDKTPEGIMAVVAIPENGDLTELLAKDDPGHLLLLYRIGNPNNLGAVIRTANWFGIRKILLSAGSVDYTNSKVVRTAMGSLFHMTIIADIDFMEAIPRIKERYFLVGSNSRKGVIPHPCGKRAALLLGSESHGLPDTLLRMTDEQWCIPGSEDADSLSLPQAAAITIYELNK